MVNEPEQHHALSLDNRIRKAGEVSQNWWRAVGGNSNNMYPTNNGKPDLKGLTSHPLSRGSKGYGPRSTRDLVFFLACGYRRPAPP